MDDAERVDGPAGRPGPLGLPPRVRACLFDLDGVLTRTASVHRAAWKQAFDPVLAEHGEPPFTEADYLAHVDGKPRADGVRDLLRSRGIGVAPWGRGPGPAQVDDATVRAIGERKNVLLLERLASGGVEVYEGSVDYVRAVRAAGLRTGAVTSSANGALVLRAAGIDDLFDVRVDGVVARERGLAGKPAPDSFLSAAADLGVGPQESAVFEDSIAGVRAGRTGGFGYVVGVDRAGQAGELAAAGADVVVPDLSELMVAA